MKEPRETYSIMQAMLFPVLEEEKIDEAGKIPEQFSALDWISGKTDPVPGSGQVSEAGPQNV